MDDITLFTPILIKLGSFAGKMKYCLIDTYFLPFLKYLHLTVRIHPDEIAVAKNTHHFLFEVEYHDRQLCVMATDRQMKNQGKYVALHELIWEDFYRCSIPAEKRVCHRNGITMDNRLENLFLLPIDLSYQVDRSSIFSSFYWQMISLLPVDMDEIDYHQSTSIDFSSHYECHNAPCTNLLSSTNEQFQCFQCQRIRYCSPMCQSFDADIHSVFCHSN